jgi:hypothetical protein
MRRSERGDARITTRTPHARNLSDYDAGLRRPLLDDVAPERGAPALVAEMPSDLDRVCQHARH